MECAERSRRGSSPSLGSKPALARSDRDRRAAAEEGKSRWRVVSFSHSMPDVSGHNDLSLEEGIVIVDTW